MQRLAGELIPTSLNPDSLPETTIPAEYPARFLSERFLFDYLDNAKLAYRLSQIMMRVGLPRLPGELLEVLPAARASVWAHREVLLSPQSESIE